MKILVLFFLSPLFLFSQTQIGDNIYGAAEGDQFGTSVSISSDGSIVAIGAPFNENAGTYTGQVRVFENISDAWIQIGEDINGAAAGDGFGTSVSISSDGLTVAIGGQGNDTGGNAAGHVRVFENISGVWTQIGGDINGSAGDLFGRNVSLSNNGLKIAIGAPGGDYVSVYENNSGTWTQLGSDIVQITDLSIYDIEFSGDGSTVSIYPLLSEQNQIRVYRFLAGNWTEIGELNDVGPNFSYSSLSYDGTVIGVTSQNNGTKVYGNISNTSWTQIGNTINNDGFGGDIDLSSDGSILAVLFRGFVSVGQVKIFQYDGNNWIERGGYLGIGGEYTITTISLSGDGAFIVDGTPFVAQNNPNTGYARVFGLSALLSSDDFVLSQFSLFPNPAKDQFAISLNKSIELEHINIYNHLAQLISTTQETTVNTSHLASGMYFVELITDKGKATKKLILQ